MKQNYKSPKLDIVLLSDVIITSSDSGYSGDGNFTPATPEVD